VSKWNAVIVGSLLAVLASTVSAQQNDGCELRVYQLEKARARHVEPTVKSALVGMNGFSDMSVDARLNAVIVRGNAETQRLAARIITNLDSPSEQRGREHAQDGDLEVRAYPVAPAELENVAGELSQRFPSGAGLRVVPDRQTSQLVVVAPSNVQKDVSSYLTRIEEPPGRLTVKPMSHADSSAASETGSHGPAPLQNADWREPSNQPDVRWRQGLLGQRYFRAVVESTRLGNDRLRDVDDSVLGYGLTFNCPLTSNIDLGARVGHRSFDGETRLPGVPGPAGVVNVEGAGTNFGALLRGHFLPDQQADPFVIVGVGYVDYSTEASGLRGLLREKEADDDFGFVGGGGVEIRVFDQSAVRPNFLFDDDGDFDIGLSVNHWFNENIFGDCGVDYTFDNDNLSFSIGLGMGF